MRESGKPVKIDNGNTLQTYMERLSHTGELFCFMGHCVTGEQGRSCIFSGGMLQSLAVAALSEKQQRTAV